MVAVGGIVTTPFVRSRFVTARPELSSATISPSMTVSFGMAASAFTIARYSSKCLLFLDLRCTMPPDLNAHCPVAIKLDLVCRLLLEKKNYPQPHQTPGRPRRTPDHTIPIPRPPPV